SLIFQESEPTAKKVLVYGKGDGVNQIKATATSIGFVKGEDNVKTIRDPTIISESEAQIRADAELVQLEQNIETYVIPIENPNRNYQLGDLLTINAKSYGVDNKEVRIVRVIRGRQGDNEFLRIEVTNSNHSKTFKNSTQRINETALISQNNETYEQGSGNTQNPQGQINATNVAPLRIPLVIDNNVVDEVGNIRINQFNLDVDVDPFRKSAGTATAVSDLLVDGTSADEQPDVLNTSGTTQPNVSGNTSSETIVHNFGVDNFNEGISTSSWDPVGSITMNEDVDLIVCAIRTYSVTSASGADLWYRIEIDGVSYAVGQLNSNAQTGNEYVFNQTIPYQLSTIGKNIGFYLRSFSNSISIDGDVRAYGVSPSHTHGDGSLTANNHSHDDGNYTAANHEHNDGSYNIPTTEVENITIGDDVSDANNVNATGFTWELREVVSGVSTVRNSGIETFTGGNTFINGIDISDSGTYPNTQGQWQIWIYPNSVDADLVKAKVNIKHNLENI
ncbi:MAG TPA: hypothetical protein DCL21_00800, partial [Alphaproteobacteria bacterium]|nr:hypothetical protein [Alphaproteobacteria bacterium]